MCCERGRSGDNPTGGKVFAFREGGQETDSCFRTTDLKIGSLVATLPSAWYRAGAVAALSQYTVAGSDKLATVCISVWQRTQLHKQICP